LFNNVETLIIEQRRLTLRFQSSASVKHCSIRVGLISGSQENDRRESDGGIRVCVFIYANECMNVW